MPEVISPAANGVLTPKTAAEVLLRDREARETECIGEVKKVLDKYGCYIRVEMRISESGIKQEVIISSK